MNKLFAATTVATFAVVKADQNGKLNVVRKFRATKGDLPKFFPMNNGEPVIGKNVVRELTFKEMVKMGLAADVLAARKLRANNWPATVEFIATAEPTAAAA